MHHTHNLLHRFVGGVFLLLSFCLIPSFAQIVFDGSPGTGAPPATLGPYTMTPFGVDNANPVNPLNGVYTPDTMMVTVPNGSLCGGSIMFTPMTDHRRIPTSWNQNWGAYQGDVYWAGPGNTLTINLPAGTHAFYFYANSEQLNATFTITAMAQDGTTSGPIPVTSSGAGVGTPGAQYFGFYTTGTTDLMAIKVSSTDPRGVAVGQFGISCQPFQAITNPPSDQKAGSFLVFPYYTSKVADGRDTRISITNVGSTAKVAIHIFFIDGSTCYQMDTFVCLTPNATIAFKTSDYDPETTGFLYALAVSPTTGIPIQQNVLIGNAFVQDGEYAGNYGAEAFWSYGIAQGAFDPFTQTATLNFGAAYDAAPSELAVTIQSPADKPNQKLVLAPVAGDLNYLVSDSDNLLFSAAAQASTGQVFNEQEKSASFSSFLTGTCLRSAIITPINPRIANSLGNLIPSGMAGSLKIKVRAAVGLLMTPRAGNNTYNGIRALHKTATTRATIQIPVFIPVC